jgi:hypothetical protein
MGPRGPAVLLDVARKVDFLFQKSVLVHWRCVAKRGKSWSLARSEAARFCDFWNSWIQKCYTGAAAEQSTLITPTLLLERSRCFRGNNQLAKILPRDFDSLCAVSTTEPRMLAIYMRNWWDSPLTARGRSTNRRRLRFSIGERSVAVVEWLAKRSLQVDQGREPILQLLNCTASIGLAPKLESIHERLRQQQSTSYSFSGLTRI